MGIWGAYRRMPSHFAVPLAAVVSALVAVGLAALGVVALDFLLTKFDPALADGPGGGLLVILTALNVAISAFIAVFCVLVNLHHRTSWLTPTSAFMLCILLIRIFLGPFGLRFSPFLLGSGAAVCVVSCWALRRNGTQAPQHVL